jgi:hypothetical protein
MNIGIARTVRTTAMPIAARTACAVATVRDVALVGDLASRMTT